MMKGSGDHCYPLMQSPLLPFSIIHCYPLAYTIIVIASTYYSNKGVPDYAFIYCMGHVQKRKNTIISNIKHKVETGKLY